MDTTSLIVNSNVQAALSFLTVSIAVSSWEIVMNFKDRFLFWSMILAFLGQLVMNIGSAVANRQLAEDLDFPLHVSQTIRLTDGVVALPLVLPDSFDNESIRKPPLGNPTGVDLGWSRPSHINLWERDVLDSNPLVDNCSSLSAQWLLCLVGDFEVFVARNSIIGAYVCNGDLTKAGARIREIIEYFESRSRGGVPSELSTKIVESSGPPD
ncbi:hypothetical protein DFJ73DRAFT_966981 [Zopfochytrium polystomum]|nr:hypothetical protein DFJ73DRAFT_966981 [Zopfochytrium polystomum]